MTGIQERVEEFGVIWFDGKKIDEAAFCSEFIKDFPMLCINDTFFTVNGMVRDESRLRREIYNRIKPYITTGISKKVTNLVDVLKLECAAKSIPIYLDRIHVRNGTYFLDGTFLWIRKIFAVTVYLSHIIPTLQSPKHGFAFYRSCLVMRIFLHYRSLWDTVLFPQQRDRRCLSLPARAARVKAESAL